MLHLATTRARIVASKIVELPTNCHSDRLRVKTLLQVQPNSNRLKFLLILTHKHSLQIFDSDPAMQEMQTKSTPTRIQFLLKKYPDLVTSL